jgi:hypothetical protein
MNTSTASSAESMIITPDCGPHIWTPFWNRDVATQAAIIPAAARRSGQPPRHRAAPVARNSASRLAH